MLPGKKIQDELPRLKKMVETSYNADKHNYNNFKDWMRFIYDTTIDERTLNYLKAAGKPAIEFNICEAYISRLVGEWDKHQPAIFLEREIDSDITDEELEIYEGHIRHELMEANHKGFQQEILFEMLGGGFSVARVKTDYAHDRAFEQVIKLEKSFDPTLDGFDPLSRLQNKSDGKYSFLNVPYKDTEVIDLWPSAKKYIEQMSFLRSSEGFNWSYQTNKEKIILVCEFFEKKYKPVELVELSNYQIMTLEEYENTFAPEWLSSGRIEQLPVIQQKRKTKLVTIHRYVFIENLILEHEETDFTKLPTVLGQGNTKRIYNSDNVTVIEKRRPLFYNMIGNQKLKNMLGQTFAQEVDTRAAHRMSIAEEAIPESEDYKDALRKPQIPNTIVYKGYADDMQTIPNLPPNIIPSPPIPSEIINAFMMTDQEMEHIIGSFDAELGMGDKDMSGRAIALGSIQSNATAKPFLVGYLDLLQSIAEIIIDLMPKYYKTKRTIPIIKKDGKKDYIVVNAEGGMQLNQKPNSMRVRVEVGPSFSIAKNIALQQIIFLSKASPLFAEFINTKGLEVILDNIEIRGIDRLKDLAKEFVDEVKQQKQMAQQAQQQQMQNNPLVIKAKTEMAKIEENARQFDVKSQLDAAEIAVNKQRADNDLTEIAAKTNQSELDSLVAFDKHQAEKTRAAVDLAISGADMHHRHRKENTQLKHAEYKMHNDSKKRQEGRQE